jgi:hypothetical protein
LSIKDIIVDKRHRLSIKDIIVFLNIKKLNMPKSKKRLRREESKRRRALLNKDNLKLFVKSNCSNINSDRYDTTDSEWERKTMVTGEYVPPDHDLLHKYIPDHKITESVDIDQEMRSNKPFQTMVEVMLPELMAMLDCSTDE